MNLNPLLIRTSGSPEDPAIGQVLALMNRFDPDHQHALQVERLSDLLFDLLADLHGMGDLERRLLRFSALLHDIGWSVPSRPHHKASMELILADQTIPLGYDDRILVALIARYHRKAHPAPAHGTFGPLPPEKMKQVRWSAGILRLADALDRSHRSLVQNISAQCTDEVIQFHCITLGDGHPDLEEEVLEKKSALLSEASGRRLEVLWN